MNKQRKKYVTTPSHWGKWKRKRKSEKETTNKNDSNYLTQKNCKQTKEKRKESCAGIMIVNEIYDAYRIHDTFFCSSPLL